MENHQQCFQTEAHPLFFDSLFPSFQTTTPETVISDYREQKRADSRAEHVSDDFEEPNIMETKNNVEFYAEVIGKLVGTIRDGFANLIDDVKHRNLKRKSSIDDAKEIRRKNKMQMTSETASQPVQKSLIIRDNDVMKKHQEIELTISHRDDEDESKPVETDTDENGKVQSPTESSPLAWTGVVQVIDRRKKHKRSEMSQQKNPDDNSGDEMDVEQLEFPIASGFPFDVDMTNELMSIDNGTGHDSRDWNRETTFLPIRTVMKTTKSGSRSTTKGA